jgi:hypothetical protein
MTQSVQHSVKQELIHLGVRRVRTPPNLPVHSLTFGAASQRITRGSVIAARGSMTVDAARATRVSFSGHAVCMDGYIRTYSVVLFSGCLGNISCE